MIEIINRELISSEQHFRLNFLYEYESKIYEINIRYKKLEGHFDSIRSHTSIVILGGYIEKEQDNGLIDKIVDAFIDDLKLYPVKDIFGECDTIIW